MRWDQDHESPDLIDRRGEGAGGGGRGIGGLLFLVPWLMRSPLGWVILIGGLIFFVARGFFAGSTQDSQSVAQHGQPAGPRPAETPETHFVAFVLDDVQASWQSQFAQIEKPYRHAKLVLYTDATQTGCGFGEAATGPFYCPTDERVYIDLGFFHELANRLGAKGQFAQAYVIAHEIGHHVQKLLGISDSVGPHAAKGATGASVRLELQADCFAGIWAHSTAQRNLLEAGDIDSALNAAAAVGDDRLQRQATGTVHPESWTHGSSAERAAWFRRGFESGRIAACDTFSAKSL